MKICLSAFFTHFVSQLFYTVSVITIFLVSLSFVFINLLYSFPLLSVDVLIALVIQGFISFLVSFLLWIYLLIKVLNVFHTP